MDWEVITKASGLMVFGVLFITLGISNWKSRREERVSIIEAAILKPTGEGPLPFNAWDRAMAYAQPVLMLIFGPAMTVAGGSILLSEVGVI